MTPDQALNVFQRHGLLYERVVGDLITRLPDGGVFVDGGAHVGEHTATMLQRRDALAVLALEPIPRLAGQLRERFGADARCQVIQAALGSRLGSTPFHVAQDAPGYSGMHSRMIASVRQWEHIEVPLVTLDSVVPDDPTAPVALIKLDLEGNEFDALRGAARTLLTSRPLVVFENSLRQQGDALGYGWPEFEALLDYTDYDVCDFFGSPVNRACWDAALRTYMFIAVPRRSRMQAWLAAALLPIVTARAASVAGG